MRFFYLAILAIASTACSSDPEGGGSGGSGGGGSTTSAAMGSNGAGNTSGNGASSANAASSGNTTGAGNTTTTGAGGSTGAADLCVNIINQYRDTLGLPPYARWTQAEPCADDQAQSDSQTGQAHGAFGQCNENAQNECPGWSGTPESILPDCLQMMWDEGPGSDFSKHGHYINMSSTNYTEVACGFHVTQGGDVWAVQDFR